MFAEIEFWEDGESRPPPDQMAVDEALFTLATRPILRTYRWDAPAVSFGYGQRLGDIREWAPGLPSVRRWTGGGLVFHDRDLTLALAIPAGLGFENKSSLVIYEEIHRSIVAAMELVTHGIRLAGAADCRPGPQCFNSPAAGDVLAAGEKLCGGALRRTKAGLIYQGSIQCNILPAPADVARAMAATVKPCQSTQKFTQLAEQLSREKYSTPAWSELR